MNGSLRLESIARRTALGLAQLTQHLVQESDFATAPFRRGRPVQPAPARAKLRIESTSTRMTLSE
jgi:hypothetical protein